MSRPPKTVTLIVLLAPAADMSVQLVPPCNLAARFNLMRPCFAQVKMHFAYAGTCLHTHQLQQVQNGKSRYSLNRTILGVASIGDSTSYSQPAGRL